MDLDSTIERHLDKAIEAIQNSRDPTQEALLFLGTWNDAYPSILVHEPFLTDSAKIQLLYLTQEARKQPHGSIVMPSVSTAAEALRHSRGTVTRDRILLRITRWISLVRRVRDTGSVQYAGNVYAIHGEPATLTDALRYDAGYMQLIEQTASDRQDLQIWRAARAALGGIDHSAAEGNDPLASIDHRSDRIEAFDTLNSRDEGGGFFGMHYSPNDNRPIGEVIQISSKSPCPNFEHGDLLDSNACNLPSSNFEHGDLQNTPCQNFEHGNYEGSSSIYITTTTKPQNSNFDSHKKEVEALQWPPSLDDNMIRLVHRTLSKVINAEHHQDILDALAHKVLDKDDPLRNPVHYVLGCCQRIRDGSFHPVGPPSKPPEIKPSNPSSSAMASNLRGEIRALEQMIKGAKTKDQQEPLEQQVERLQQRLNEVSMQNAAD